MADPTESKGSGGAAAAEAALAGAPSTGRLKTLLIFAAGVLVLAAGAGYGLALLLPGSHPTPVQAEAGTTPASAAEPPAAPNAEATKPDFIYYDFEPIVVNLDEPRLARYVRATITLAIKPANHEAAKAVLDKHKPELRNWLTLYFANCTLDNVRGAASLNRLRREILDAFCQQLWPDQKPLIEHVLFKEFGVS